MKSSFVVPVRLWHWVPVVASWVLERNRCAGAQALRLGARSLSMALCDLDLDLDLVTKHVLESLLSEECARLQSTSL